MFIKFMKFLVLLFVGTAISQCSKHSASDVKDFEPLTRPGEVITFLRGFHWFAEKNAMSVTENAQDRWLILAERNKYDCTEAKNSDFTYIRAQATFKIRSITFPNANEACVTLATRDGETAGLALRVPSHGRYVKDDLKGRDIPKYEGSQFDGPNAQKINLLQNILSDLDAAGFLVYKRGMFDDNKVSTNGALTYGGFSELNFKFSKPVVAVPRTSTDQQLTNVTYANVTERGWVIPGSRIRVSLDIPVDFGVAANATKVHTVRGFWMDEALASKNVTLYIGTRSEDGSIANSNFSLKIDLENHISIPEAYEDKADQPETSDDKVPKALNGLKAEVERELFKSVFLKVEARK